MDVDCSLRKVTVGVDVTVMFSGSLLIQPFNPPKNIAVYMSVLNLSLVCMLVRQLYSNIVSGRMYVLRLIFLLW